MSEIIILDVEASGLEDESYPIEIAWGLSVNSIESLLICPDETWNNAPYSAEGIHGIKQSSLYANGLSTEDSSKVIISALSGKIVYTDAPNFDEKWMLKLLRLHNKSINIEFVNINNLWIRKLYPIYGDYGSINRQINMAKSMFVLNNPIKHRATDDVKWLFEFTDFLFRGL